MLCLTVVSTLNLRLGAFRWLTPWYSHVINDDNNNNNNNNNNNSFIYPGYWLGLTRPLATITVNMQSQTKFSTNEIKPNQVKYQIKCWSLRRWGKHREKPLDAKSRANELNTNMAPRPGIEPKIYYNICDSSTVYYDIYVSSTSINCNKNTHILTTSVLAKKRREIIFCHMNLVLLPCIHINFLSLTACKAKRTCPNYCRRS